MDLFKGKSSKKDFLEMMLDNSWEKPVKEVVKGFIDKIRLLDAPGARRLMIDLISLTRGDFRPDEVKRDASIALELIRQIDHDHPEQTLIDSVSWKGDMDQIKKNVKNDLKFKNYDEVVKIIPKLLYMAESNKDLYTRVKCVEILEEISSKHPMIVEQYQSRFFRMMYDESLDITQYVAEILYNIDFHTFGTRNVEKIRKILNTRYKENLINSFSQLSYVRHFLKYGLTIENFTKEWIWDVNLYIRQDPGFKIVKVEPDFPIKKDKMKKSWVVDLNSIQPQDAKKVFLYIDLNFQPIMSIQTKLTYKDSDGKLYSKEFKSETIDLYLISPKFETNVNFGLSRVKEYLEFNAKVRDNRKFLIPEILGLNQLTVMLKNIITAESILNVHEYKTEGISDEADYYSEIYFHGLTKNTKEDVVIISRISGEDKTLNLIMGANRDIIITGLYNKILSRLHSSLDGETLKELICPKCLEPIDVGFQFCPNCKAQI